MSRKGRKGKEERSEDSRLREIFGIIASTRGQVPVNDVTGLRHPGVLPCVPFRSLTSRGKKIEMVRKSILVYDLLRTEQPEEGFTEKEIVEQISNKHDIMPGKALRKQVAVALRRGVDFGIIAKKNNKFRLKSIAFSFLAAANEPTKNT